MALELATIDRILSKEDQDKNNVGIYSEFLE